VKVPKKVRGRGMNTEEKILKIPSAMKPIEYVVEGATLKCSKGSCTCKLKTPRRNRIYIGEHLQANIKDSRPNGNIGSFGECRPRDKRCKPKIKMDWLGGKSDVIIDGASALLVTSTIKCIYGGTIRITDSGQKVRDNLDSIDANSLLLMLGLGATHKRVAKKEIPVSIPGLVAAAMSFKTVVELTNNIVDNKYLKKSNAQEPFHSQMVAYILSTITAGIAASAFNPSFTNRGKTLTAAAQLMTGELNPVELIKEELQKNDVQTQEHPGLPEPKGPGYPFASPDEAAKDWARMYNDDSIRERRELASSIYIMEDENGNVLTDDQGNVLYSYTVPYEGGQDIVAPSPPENGEKVIGDIHSHGHYMESYYLSGDQDAPVKWVYDGNNMMSEEDMDTGEINYLVSPNGVLSRWIGTDYGADLTYLGRLFPYDPNDPTSPRYGPDELDPNKFYCTDDPSVNFTIPKIPDDYMRHK
jgi:hypothetical protein